MSDLTFKKFIEVNLERSEKGFNHSLRQWSILEWGGATVGEFGEALNIAKKLIRYRDNIKGNKPGENQSILLEKLGREIADGIIYSILWSKAAGIDLEAAIIKAFNDKSDEIGSDIKI